jgi:hypothetical protein
MTIIVAMGNLEWNNLDLNSLKKSEWKNIGIKIGLNVVMTKLSQP